MGRRMTRRILLIDSRFELVGRLDGVYIDPDGGAWANVDVGGLFTSLCKLVPLQGAQWLKGCLRLKCSRQSVRTAPGPAGSLLLDPAEAATLRTHYSIDAA